jgi:hypothetical protein
MTDLQAEHLGPVEIKHVGSATVTVLSRRLRRVRWDRRIHVGSAGSSHAGLSAHEAGIHQSPVWWCRVSRPGRTTRGRARDAPTENRTTIAYHRRFAAHAPGFTARSESAGPSCGFRAARADGRVADGRRSFGIVRWWRDSTNLLSTHQQSGGRESPWWRRKAHIAFKTTRRLVCRWIGIL